MLSSHYRLKMCHLVWFVQAVKQEVQWTRTLLGICFDHSAGNRFLCLVWSDVVVVVAMVVVVVAKHHGIFSL